MDITVADKAGISVVSLSGRMDATTTAAFEEAGKSLLEAGKTTLVIDMAQLEYVSSAGLRGILGLLKTLKTQSGKMAFCALQPMVAEVFRISGFNSILSVSDTLDSALSSLAEGQRG